MEREEIKRRIQETFEEVPKPQGVTLKVMGLIPQAILLEPANEQAAQALASYREDLAQAFEIDPDTLADYQYHMSITYVVDTPTPALKKACRVLEETVLEIPEFELPTPQVTFYQNMLAFEKLRICETKN